MKLPYALKEQARRRRRRQRCPRPRRTDQQARGGFTGGPVSSTGSIAEKRTRSTFRSRRAGRRWRQRRSSARRHRCGPVCSGGAVPVDPGDDAADTAAAGHRRWHLRSLRHQLDLPQLPDGARHAGVAAVQRAIPAGADRGIESGITRPAGRRPVGGALFGDGAAAAVTGRRRRGASGGSGDGDLSVGLRRLPDRFGRNPVRLSQRAPSGIYAPLAIRDEWRGTLQAHGEAFPAFLDRLLAQSRPE